MTQPLDVRRTFAAVAVSATITIAGCSRAPEAPQTSAPKPAAPAGHDGDHDHDDHGHDHGDHEHPRTLSAGARRLAVLAASVKDHLAAEARDDADAAVHDMGHLLEDLQELVRTSDLAVDAKAAATKALDDLFECFDALDASLHAEPGKGESPAEVHASVARRIGAAIGALEAAGAAKAAAVEDDAAAIIRDAEARKKKEQE